ncbi:hypothetical protein MTR_6g052260 [Medicago truncatula]|uniref:AIPP2-like SPOC-like domain-containing protein n=1 Tax=Medicago truncatula TaxID=3880 RepID=G7KL46_MEDTR|nr:hypothetical protein MTR_6g052260 [Medicago truncatula]
MKNTSADENGECAAASVHPQPIADPIWRGCLKVSNIGKVIELMGHLSTLACPKVHEEARYLPNMISANFLQKSTVWPESFKNSGTNNFSIGIYFLSPHNPSVDGSFDELVEEMISDKLAIKVGVVNADLLIFPSTDLPSEYRTFQSRYYLWGVFRRKQTSIKNNYIDYKIEKRKLEMLTRFHQRVMISRQQAWCFRVLNRVRILGKRDTIFKLAGYVFRIRLVVPWVVLFEGELEEKETWITKEVALGLSVFVVRISWVGNKYLKDGVLEQRKRELELIHAKNTKISYKNILCKEFEDPSPKYEDLIQKYEANQYKLDTPPIYHLLLLL